MIQKPIMWEGPFGDPLPLKVRALIRALADERGSGGSVLALDDETTDIAMTEGLGPLLGARVAADRIGVPRERREALLWEHHGCIADNLVRARAVEALVSQFDERAIPIVLLKGMALIQSTFAAGERSMVDIDVLVPPSRWQEACDLARADGFETGDLPGRAYTADHDYVRSFTTPGGVVFEIHRFVCEETIFTLDYEGRDGLFARARKLATGLFLPEAGDLFLTLVAHAAKHTFDLPLRSYVDGVFMLWRQDLPIEELAVRARGWRMETAFSAWMRCLWRLEGSDDDRCRSWSDSPRSRWGRFVWSRTNHASPWQRFVRLAWLTDSGPQWTRHVATRLRFRVQDAISGPAASQAGTNVGTNVERKVGTKVE